MTQPPPSPWLVSACLLGRPCRYDGKSKNHPGVAAAVSAHQKEGGRVVPVCPEELGGLSTPRPAAELRGGNGAAVLRGEAQVLRLKDEMEVTQAFVMGALRAYSKAPDAELAILKARSPSCGSRQCQLDGKLQSGQGVFAALLQSKGLAIRNEEAFDEQSPKAET